MTAQPARPDHTGFTVSDLDGPIGWLTQVFGFALDTRGGRPAGMASALTGVPGVDVEIAFLDLPGLRLELLCYARPASTLPDPATPGAAHIALMVPDLAARVAASAAHGVRLLGRVITVPDGPRRGTQLAYLGHPAGVFVELVQPAEKS